MRPFSCDSYLSLCIPIQYFSSNTNHHHAQSPPKHVSESDDDNTDYRDELAGALCLLCLRLGDKKGAKKQIVGRADFLRRLCIQTPSLLYKELLADDGKRCCKPL
eukprot:m.166517 g.166517  ORF g.166517 m.166517 type:complete len:105 (-) comp31429_c1_seq7:1171-1485(-)